MTDEIVYRNPYGQEMLTLTSNGMSWSYDVNMRGNATVSHNSIIYWQWLSFSQSYAQITCLYYLYNIIICQYYIYQ